MLELASLISCKWASDGIKRIRAEGGRYRVQPIDLLRLRCRVSPAIRAIRTAKKASSGGTGGRGTNGTTEGAHLRLGGALACLPRGLERLEYALYLPPRRRVPRLELGLVRMDKYARVLHARWRRADSAVGYGDHRGAGAAAGRRREWLSEICVRIKLGEQLLLLLLLLLRGVAVAAGWLGLLIAVAGSCLLRRIVRVLALHL